MEETRIKETKKNSSLLFLRARISFVWLLFFYSPSSWWIFFFRFFSLFWTWRVRWHTIMSGSLSPITLLLLQSHEFISRPLNCCSQILKNKIKTGIEICWHPQTFLFLKQHFSPSSRPSALSWRRKWKNWFSSPHLFTAFFCKHCVS
jgi:hypothetical protein